MKKNNLKRLVSYYLALAMVLGQSPILALALDRTDDNDNPNVIEVIDDLNVEELNQVMDTGVKEVTGKSSDKLLPDEKLPAINKSLQAPKLLPQNRGSLVEISSWDQLKDELEVKVGTHSDPFYDMDRLEFKNRNYKLTGDITIDLNDPYFDDKDKFIHTGILSLGEYVVDKDKIQADSFSFDGDNHTITIKARNGQPARALFGRIFAKDLSIKGINLVIEGDVLGRPFIDMIHGGEKIENNCLAAGAMLENISVKVKGNVVPEANGKPLRYTDGDFANFNFYGSMATGFAYKVVNTSMKNIKVDIDGNVGSKDPISQEEINRLKDNYPGQIAFHSAAYGFMFAADRPIPRMANNYNPPDKGETHKQIFVEGNSGILKQLSYMEDIDVKIGGSILSTGYQRAFGAGFAHSSDDTWVERLNINIGGDIDVKAITDVPQANVDSKETVYADGFSDEVGVLKDSSLKVNRITLDVDKDVQLNVNKFTGICGISNTNGGGYYNEIKGNKLDIKEISAKSPYHIIATLGYMNAWNSSGKKGSNWNHIFEDNTFNIGKINFEQLGDYVVQYYGLGEKFRTGVLSDTEKQSGYKDLREVSAKNNKIDVDELTVKNPGSYGSLICPSFYNASNAKDNSINYGKIDINSKSCEFVGLGQITNFKPSEDNKIIEVTSGNRLKFGDINISADNCSDIHLMGGQIAPGKTLKDNIVSANSLTAKIADANPKPLYLSGMSFYNAGNIEDCHVFLGDLDVKNTSRTILGLGVAYNKGNVKNSSVLVDNDMKLDLSGGFTQGIFVGSSGAGNFDNCHSQVNGVIYTKSFPDGSIYGGFGGRLYTTNVSNSSNLIFNGFAPFVHTMKAGSLDRVANYSSEGNWKYSGGLLDSYIQDYPPTIKNSTYLVDRISEYTDSKGTRQEKNNEDSVLYRDGYVSPESGNNYIVLVGKKGKDKFNRAAYPIAKRTSTPDEMGPETPEVWARDKNAKEIGKINIAGRSFQDKYWGENAQVYQTGQAEKDFNYVDQNPNNISLLPFGSHKDIVKDAGKKASLLDYRNRHAGLYVENGPIYDLLGIKGYSEKKSDSGSGSAPGPEQKPIDERISGDDRVETSEKVSEKFFGKAKTVIIVDSGNYPDALTASPLAYTLDAPILLNRTDRLEDRVAKEIVRLGAEEIIIVGGPNSISKNVKESLKKYDKDTVERISGPNRYDTSSQVARRLSNILGGVNKAIVASGEVFPDALSSAPLACKEKMPILLARKTRIDDSVKDSIKDLNIKSVYITGGENTLNKSLESDLPKLIQRFAGIDRYETAVKLAENKFPNASNIFLASGENWPDALVIGPVAGRLNSPIILTKKDPVEVTKAYIKKIAPKRIYVIGGRDSIKDSTVDTYFR